jgi:hypothetical protein
VPDHFALNLLQIELPQLLRGEVIILLQRGAAGVVELARFLGERNPHNLIHCELPRSAGGFESHLVATDAGLGNATATRRAFDIDLTTRFVKIKGTRERS